MFSSFLFDQSNCCIVIFFKSNFAKKASEIGGEAASQAKRAAETVSKQALDFSETTAYKKVSEVS